METLDDFLTSTKKVSELSREQLVAFIKECEDGGVDLLDFKIIFRNELLKQIV